MSVAIIGNGGQGREVRSYFDKIGIDYRVFVSDEFYDESDDTTKLSELDIERHHVLVCIADVSAKEKIVSSLPKETNYFTFIHPSAQVYSNHPIGEGSIICPNVVITTNVKLGKHSLINCNSTIGHDTVIADYFTLNPNSAIAGNCNIGEKVFIGSSAAVREKLTIVDDVIIGMGAIVISDIYKSGTYVGLPAKEIKS